VRGAWLRNRRQPACAASSLEGCARIIGEANGKVQWEQTSPDATPGVARPASYRARHSVSATPAR
jgi:hypothetical protein